MTSSTRTVPAVLLVVALLVLQAVPATAHHRPGHVGGPPGHAGNGPSQPDPEPDPDPQPDPEPDPDPGRLDGKQRIDFGPVEVGTRADVSLALTNVGGAALELTGTNSSNPAFTDDFDGEPVALASGEWMSLTVWFSPDTTGDTTAQLTISHTGADGPHVVTLTGIGTDAPGEEPDAIPTLVFSAAPAGCGAGCLDRSALWVSDADGEHLQQLTRPDARSDRFARWSPDGTAMAFTRVDPASGRGEIHLIDVQDDRFSPSRRVTYTKDLNGAAGCDGDAMVPEWSPTGSRLAFTCAAGYGRSSVHVVTADGDVHFQVPHDDDEADAAPTWSPDGTRIAFERLDTRAAYGRPGRLTIWTAEVGAATTTGFDRLVSGDTAASQPVWSPDGARILYLETDELTFDTGLSSVASTTGASTSHLTMPGGGGREVYDATWSPDGGSVAFLTGDAMHHSALEVLDVGSGKVTRISSADALAFAPSWSADGSVVLHDRFGYEDGDSRQRVAATTADGSSTSFLTPPELHAFDGRRRTLQ